MRLVPAAWLSDDGAAWHEGPFIPSSSGAGPVADPLPGPAFGAAGSSAGLVVSNPRYGARVWLIAAGELAAGSDE